MSFCETPMYYPTEVMAPFYRAFLNLTLTSFVRVVQILMVLKGRRSTVRVEGVRELRLDTGHNSRAYSSEASVGLAQLIFPSRLRSRPILTLVQLVNTPILPSSLSCPPPLSSFCLRFNHQSPYSSPLSVIFRRHGCKRSTAPSI